MKTPVQQYMEYITTHIGNVERGYRWLQEFIPHVITEPVRAEKQILTHDESKFNSIEFDPYVEYFYGPEENQADPTINKNFDFAWNHHQKCNEHHWQYWVLQRDDGTQECIDIPNEFIIEMICDWWSFSWAEGNLHEIFNWYSENKNVIKLSENSRLQVESILDQIKEKLKELE